jgi:hypothetical protein
MAVKGCSRGFSRGWVVAASLALTLLAAEANLAARWTAVQAPGEAAPVAAARYAPDRVVVKLTPEAALAVMGRGGATSPGLARALQAVGAQAVRPPFADLWPAGQAGPIRAADKLKGPGTEQSCSHRPVGRAAARWWQGPSSLCI